jgi:hypothetical protein
MRPRSRQAAAENAAFGRQLFERLAFLADEQTPDDQFAQVLAEEAELELPHQLLDVYASGFRRRLIIRRMEQLPGGYSLAFRARMEVVA